MAHPICGEGGFVRLVAPTAELNPKAWPDRSRNRPNDLWLCLWCYWGDRS
ncbi:hypothetical protein H6G51_04095 [Limnothrix sp. FACHB-708]|nr:MULTISPECIES: hypothetical protein [unclassified Limnothrix]MBD2552455.1 hypothetical protein [Limnothrix sp. FACHB-708]MBD2590321.1 hypothetical protein [Limnothrix sp. FACHB-406]